MLRSRIASSSSRSFARRSISSLLDRQRAFVLVDAVTVEDAHFDDRAVHARRQRSDVSRTSAAFSPKMARSSFSSGVIGLSPFGVTLPTRMSPALHFGADVHDAGFVEVLAALLRRRSECRG